MPKLTKKIMNLNKDKENNELKPQKINLKMPNKPFKKLQEKQKNMPIERKNYDLHF